MYAVFNHETKEVIHIASTPSSSRPSFEMSEEDDTLFQNQPAGTVLIVNEDGDALTTKPYVTEVVVPDTVLMAQLREEMYDPQYSLEGGTTLRDAVEQAVSTAGGVLKDWWDTAPNVRRDSPKVAAMAAALGISDETLDALWIGAALN